jgi:hypothetical protein
LNLIYIYIYIYILGWNWKSKSIKKEQKKLNQDNLGELMKPTIKSRD